MANLKVLYQPKGLAGEYSKWAINISTYCKHGCRYCFCPLVLKKDREEFHSKYETRKDIVALVKSDLQKFGEKGQHILLSFTTDPFVKGQEHTATREIIKLIHESGNYVNILTKGELTDEDIDCLNSSDIFGTTITCYDKLAETIEPNALAPSSRIAQLARVKMEKKCKTWVSCEPVYETQAIYDLITNYANYFDTYKIGKLNYEKSDIDWKSFGNTAEKLCQEYKVDYYIKDSLRKEMNKN